MNQEIDLKKPSDVEKPSPKLDEPKDYYPTVYLSDISGLKGLKVGDEVMIRGKVGSVTSSERKDKDSTSVEIECVAIMPKGGKNPKAKKEKFVEENDEIERGLQEAEQEEKEEMEG